MGDFYYNDDNGQRNTVINDIIWYGVNFTRLCIISSYSISVNMPNILHIYHTGILRSHLIFSISRPSVIFTSNKKTAKIFKAVGVLQQLSELHVLFNIFDILQPVGWICSIRTRLTRL